MTTPSTSSSDPGTTAIAVVGGGSIGSGFAIVFARAGFEVRLFEPDAARRRQLLPEIEQSCDDLREFDLLEIDQDMVDSRIHVLDDLAIAVDGAELVQECAPEDLALKRELFAELDSIASGGTPLASSSSAITASEFAMGLQGAARCLVGHPGNPPTLINVVELVAAPFTSHATLEIASAIYARAALRPVIVHGEPKGFVFNRLQGAMLREAYCLVRDGVASVDDIDAIVRDGLGMRWSVVGPFETADLNRRGGIAAHAEIMGDAYAAMGAERGQDDPWTPELIARIADERRALLPLSRWEERVRWRDRELMATLADRRRRDVSKHSRQTGETCE
jgi:3-hydroxyacyl-CoA dehydrogenase